MAVRVLSTAILRELVVDLPRSVVVYGRTLDTRELQWLVDGMGAHRTADLPERGPNGETCEITGVILGRVVRLQLTQKRHADLITTGVLARAS
jgi:hypothetical protein